jgi:hypothetical protein
MSLVPSVRLASSHPGRECVELTYPSELRVPLMLSSNGTFLPHLRVTFHTSSAFSYSMFWKGKIPLRPGGRSILGDVFVFSCVFDQVRCRGDR